MRKQKDNFAILLRNRNRDIRHGDGYGIMEINVVKLVGNTVENPGHQHPFDGLEFHCQWDTKTDHLNNTDHTYGWETSYKGDLIYCVRLGDVNRMRKTLQKAENAFLRAKIRPLSFGQYVTVVCMALGISGVMKESILSADTLTYRERDFYYWSLEDAAGLIDRQIAQDRHPESRDSVSEGPALAAKSY